MRVRLDKKSTSISLLVALGVRQDGQKVLLAVKNMGGESEAAWRALLDDLANRGLKTPELAIVDGAPGLEKALAALWSDVPVQRCTGGLLKNCSRADSVGADDSGISEAADARVLLREGVGFAAICSNDAVAYPEDSFSNMKQFAQAHDFPFPYLQDETQSAAQAYDAVCTPDFFGYDRDRKLKYRGRLDEGRTTPPPAGARRELVEAMRAIATTGLAPPEQMPAIGCSIKWKANRG